ncbi:MAG: SUMF1/EgtB/PvdO family nonheme iron enzyme, partial [Candidatus Saccharimonas sp.]|nr:SUMF1/EgtB/PvdO family nonheme iron enzyme [Planctomycetaceae bacterium]
AGEDAGVAYLVMECIDGTDLSSCVRTHGPLSVAHAVECLAQAAEGLEYAHRQGVIHRDIKPSNLVLCHDRTNPATGNVSGATGGSFGPPVAPDQDSKTIAHHDGPHHNDSPHAIPPTALRVKVLDLGLARFNADAATTKEGSALTHSGVMFGTPEYMSPEQAVSASTADARSDIYSLGCTLYFLLTGRTVVVGESFLETVMAHQIQNLPSLSAARDDVPAELEQIYRQMTARRVDQRFRSMQEVRDALREIPTDRLPRVPSPVRKPDATRKTPARETAVSGNPATDWLSPLDHDDQRAATVLVTDLDVPSVVRQRLSPQSRIIEWAKSNRSTSFALTAVTIGLLIAAAVWWGALPGDQATLAGRDNTANRNAAPQTPPPPKVPRPEVLTCPATTTLVQQRQREWAEYLGTPTSIQNSIGLTLCLIPPGEFTMGTSDAELDAFPGMGVPQYEVARVRDEMPAHRVLLTKPFWIGQTEVTIGQFRKFVEAEHFITETEQTAGYGLVNRQWVRQRGFSWKNVGEDVTMSDEHPASNITWNDAVAFCDWLSRHESRETGRPVRYRLPTEAEWEFACRAGTDSPWYFGSDQRASRNHAIFLGNADLLLQPVGTRLENPFHLFDVSGNQSEWCRDWFAPYGSDEATDPTGPLNGQERVQRGGNFASPPFRLRSASRQHQPPTSPQNGSVRVVREL